MNKNFKNITTFAKKYKYYLIGATLLPVIRYFASGAKCKIVKSLEGKVVIVTGASAGIGKI